jgi:hypothetical protein
MELLMQFFIEYFLKDVIGNNKISPRLEIVSQNIKTSTFHEMFNIIEKESYFVEYIVVTTNVMRGIERYFQNSIYNKNNNTIFGAKVLISNKINTSNIYFINGHEFSENKIFSTIRYLNYEFEEDEEFEKNKEKMFVLVNLNPIDIESSEPFIVAVSKDRDKLEKEIERLCSIKIEYDKRKELLKKYLENECNNNLNKLKEAYKNINGIPIQSFENHKRGFISQQCYSKTKEEFDLICKAYNFQDIIDCPNIEYLEVSKDYHINNIESYLQIFDDCNVL